VVLVGFMGCGKSSVGRALAERLGWGFLDTDLLVEEALGKPVREIFAAEGEAAFRAAEAEVVRRAAAARGMVIATGGGALNDPESRSALRAGGVLIWLCARPEAILARVGPAEDRPLLAGAADPLAAVEDLLARRTPLYAQADYTLDTSDLSLEAVVEQLCAVLPSLLNTLPMRS
jgi:shikimate kinase